MNVDDLTDILTASRGPWAAIVTSVDEAPMRFTLRGVIFYENEIVGEFTRLYSASTNIIHHSKLTLEDDYQNRGFASWWFNHCLHEYRRHGISAIQMYAMDAGRFVWRRFGFTATVLQDFQRESALFMSEKLLARAKEENVVSDREYRVWRRNYCRWSREAEDDLTVHNIMDLELGDHTVSDVLRMYPEMGATLAWTGILAIENTRVAC